MANKGKYYMTTAIAYTSGKPHIGNTYEILETCEKIYIGNDFPDEFCHSKDKIRLKGANEKAKAKKGWYRYDTRFGIPKYDENGDRKKRLMLQTQAAYYYNASPL